MAWKRSVPAHRESITHKIKLILKKVQYGHIYMMSNDMSQFAYYTEVLPK